MRIFHWWLMVSPLLCRVGEGEGGDGGGDGDGGDGGNPGGGDRSMLEGAVGDKGDGDGDGGEGGDAPQHFVTFGEDGAPGERPDWVPEQFWNAEQGYNAGAAARSYSELRADTNARLAKAQQMDEGGKPENASDYLKDWKLPDSEGDDGPDFSRFGELKGDDPALVALAETLHEHGVSQKRFDEIARGVMSRIAEHLPEPFNIEAEWERLGGEERGKKMSAGVAAAAKALVGGEHPYALNETEYRAVLRMGRSATEISALSKIFARMNGETGPGLPVGGATNDGAPTMAEAHAAQGVLVAEGPDKGKPRYDVDPAYRAKVDRMWELAAGTGRTGNSSRLPVSGSNA